MLDFETETKSENTVSLDAIADFTYCALIFVYLLVSLSTPAFSQEIEPVSNSLGVTAAQCEGISDDPYNGERRFCMLLDLDVSVGHCDHINLQYDLMGYMYCLQEHYDVTHFDNVGAIVTYIENRKYPCDSMYNPLTDRVGYIMCSTLNFFYNGFCKEDGELHPFIFQRGGQTRSQICGHDNSNAVDCEDCFAFEEVNGGVRDLTDKRGFSFSVPDDNGYRNTRGR